MAFFWWYKYIYIYIIFFIINCYYMRFQMYIFRRNKRYKYIYIYIFILFSSLSIVIICDSKCTFWEQIKDRLQGRIHYRATTCRSLWKQTFYFSFFTSILFFNVILQFCYNLGCSKKSIILCMVKKTKWTLQIDVYYFY